MSLMGLMGLLGLWRLWGFTGLTLTGQTLRNRPSTHADAMSSWRVVTRADRRRSACDAPAAPTALRPAQGAASYSGSAVVFFTVRSTSIEFERSTPGRRINTSV